MYKISKNIKAFTLAEVLITLLIIGVVASIIIPNLINDSQEAEFHAAWKKAYSDLDQATRRIVLDNGGSLKKVCTTPDHTCLQNLYTPYLNVSKVNTDSAGWHLANEWFFYNKVKVTWGVPANTVLTNGNLIRFQGSGFPDCTNNTWVGTRPICAFICTDINGFKGPNTVGHDIYFMVLTENRLLPVGTTGDGFSDCISTGYGYACAAKFLYQ